MEGMKQKPKWGGGRCNKKISINNRIMRQPRWHIPTNEANAQNSF